MQIVTAADRPDLDTEAGAAFREKWPEFIFHDDVAAQYAPRVETHFSRYNIFVLDDDGPWSPAGGACRWPGTAPSRTSPTGTTVPWSARSTGTRRVARARR